MLVVREGRERRRTRIDRVPCLAVAVGASHREAVERRLRQAPRHVPGRADALVLDDHGVGDHVGRGVVDPVARPSRAIVHSGECRLRRGQVGVDVVDAVHVRAVDEFGGAGDAPRQPVVDRQIRTPALGELEVRIGHVQLEAGGPLACHVRRLVPIGIRMEGTCRRVLIHDLPDEDTGVSQLV